MGWRFENRGEAGIQLARELKQYRSRAAAMAVGAGGVAVAAEVARLLYVPLGIVPVVQLRGPEGATFGALAPGGVAVVDWSGLAQVGEEAARAIVASQQVELDRLVRVFGEFMRLPAPPRRNVILMADTIDTGLEMRAAMRAVRAEHPAGVMAAAPVVSARARRELMADGCDCVALIEAGEFGAPAGEWYRDWRGSSEAEDSGQLELLARYARFTVA